MGHSGNGISAGKWKPLLHGDLRGRALEAIDAIAKSLEKRAVANASLAGGTAGSAVFYSYLAEARGEGGDEHTALRFLDQAGEAVAATRMSPDLFGGFSGIAWAMAHLERGLLEVDSVEAVDEALELHLRQARWHREYDLVSGLVGFGVYALERLPRRTAVPCLALVVEHLDATAERSATGVTWFTPPELLPPHQREQSPNGHYNLGLAHGVPGVIALLGQICATSVETLPPSRAKARPLLDSAVAWLLAQQPVNSGEGFPPYVAAGVVPRGSRVAWCYGDLGIAAALLLAARAVRNPTWERAALKIARRAAARRSDESGVIDCGLCHGAAGVGHLFNRLFQATGDEILADAARFWVERALKLRKPGTGIAGFSALHFDAKTGQRQPVAEIGIVEGAAGVGLALLAAATPIEPEWDRLLLVAIPPRSEFQRKKQNGENKHDEDHQNEIRQERSREQEAAA